MTNADWALAVAQSARDYREPMCGLGEVTDDGRTIIEHWFRINPDGSTTEHWKDHLGNSATGHVTPDGHYTERAEPIKFNWPDNNVFVFYVNRFSLAEASAPVGSEWVSTATSPWECYETFVAQWERCDGRPFISLNQDVICRPDVIKSFEECPEPWCRYGYLDIPENVVTGCTRWRPELQTAALEILREMRGPHRRWNVMADSFASALKRRGFKPHLHTPPVIHLDKDGVAFVDKETREQSLQFERAIPRKKETR